MNEMAHMTLNGFKRWLTSCLLFFMLVACRNQQAVPAKEIPGFYDSIALVKPLIKSGDVIFRNGTDEVSRAARSMNRIDTSFSHCGLILIENDSLMVYHAIGGQFNPPQTLRRDPVDSFLTPAEVDRFAIYRYALTKAQSDTLASIIRKYYRSGLKFDLFFNFESDETMYCSEFVYKCLNSSLSDSLASLILAREWPYGISPDDLFLNPRSTLLKRVDF